MADSTVPAHCLDGLQLNVDLSAYHEALAEYQSACEALEGMRVILSSASARVRDFQKKRDRLIAAKKQLLLQPESPQVDQQIASLIKDIAVLDDKSQVAKERLALASAEEKRASVYQRVIDSSESLRRKWLAAWHAVEVALLDSPQGKQAIELLYAMYKAQAKWGTWPNSYETPADYVRKNERISNALCATQDESCLDLLDINLTQDLGNSSPLRSDEKEFLSKFRARRDKERREALHNRHASSWAGSNV